MFGLTADKGRRGRLLVRAHEYQYRHGSFFSVPLMFIICGGIAAWAAFLRASSLLHAFTDGGNAGEDYSCQQNTGNGRRRRRCLYAGSRPFSHRTCSEKPGPGGNRTWHSWLFGIERCGEVARRNNNYRPTILFHAMTCCHSKRPSTPTRPSGWQRAYLGQLLLGAGGQRASANH